MIRVIACLALLAAGCVTRLEDNTTYANGVVFFRKPAPGLKTCERLGEVVAASPAMSHPEVSLIEQAKDAGATHVLETSFKSSAARGIAYRCAGKIAPAPFSLHDSL
jgi:hypothetical protein